MRLLKISMLALVLSFALTQSCSSMDHIPLADDSWKNLTVSHDIPVEGIGCKLSEETAKKLAIEIDRFPSAHKNLIAVYISTQLRDGIVGLYKHSTIYVILSDLPYMKKVLWHELSHAMVAGMPNSYLYEWCEVFAVRLEHIGLETSARDKWSELKNYEGFPTPYSTRNVHEFIAEHVMEFVTNPERHAYLFPKEHALIKKHKLSPVR